jgi:hypothetical protein
MIIQTISTASQFRDAFHAAGRGTQFSYQALGLIFDYLDECDEQTELDPVAVCCEYSEMDADEVRSYYSIDDYADVVDYLTDNTVYLGETPSGHVFVQF